MNHDRKLGVRLVAGADEAGRGCLAGPLVAAAVVLDYERLRGPLAAPLGHLNDSKKLTPDMRSRMYDVVMQCATAWSVVAVAPETIDRDGLHVCNLRALGAALQRLSHPFDVAMSDGFRPGDLPFECTAIVRGDATSASIAAAAIIAKVTRDRLMCRLDDRLAGRWGFAEHMGYATPEHRERIREHGVSRYHRRSFASTAYDDDMWARVDAMLDAP